MRDIVLLGIFAISIIQSLRNPFFAILVYYWISIMAPHRYTYGVAYYQPLAMIAALTAVASSFIHIRQLKFPKTRESYLFLFFVFFITLTTVFSIYPDEAWSEWKDVIKVLLMCFVSMLVITTRERLFYFIVGIIVFVGVISLKGAIFGVLTAGQYRVWGPEESNLADNNFVGLAMVMIIPFCFFLKNEFKKKVESYGLLSIGFASIVSAILTYSRGALLGLLAIGLSYFLKSKRKILVGVLTLIVIGIGVSKLPQHWFDRMHTIEVYGEDSSAEMRLNSWRFSFNIGKAHVLGGGFGCFTPEQYRIHAPDPQMNLGYSIDKYGNKVVHAQTSHSIYFEVMAEHGLIGFALYITILISMLFSLHKVERITKKLPATQWISNYSRAFYVSLVGFMISGAFVSRAFFELFWAIYSAAICFMSIVYSGSWIDHPADVRDFYGDNANTTEHPISNNDVKKKVRTRSDSKINSNTR